MMPLPPPLLSTITGWPHICVSLSAITRIVTSVEAPGGNGTTKVTRCDGKASLATARCATPAPTNPASAARRPMHLVISLPLAFLAASMAAGGLARHRRPLSYGGNNGSEHQVTQQRPLKGAWGITALLFLFMLINFADNVVVGLVGPSIRSDPSLNLTAKQFGLLGSSFFFLFAISAVLVGFLSNRVQAKRTLLVMAIVWSLVQFPMLGTVTLEVLIACRVVLGAGEGPAAPVATHAVYKWFPDALRGLPTAVISQGSAFGVIVAVPALTWVIAHYSWHWAFGALGIAGLLWSVLWFFLGKEGTLVDPPIANATGEHVPYRYLLTCPSIIAVCLAGFASYWGLALGLTWFTSYLVDALHFSKEAGGNLTAVPWVFGACVLLVGGSISQRLKSAGTSSRACRGVLACAKIVVGGCTLPFVGSMPTPELKLACLVFGSAIGSRS